LIQQNNMTENHLSITISAEELRQIEAQASPEREKSGRCLKHIGRERRAMATEIGIETRQSRKVYGKSLQTIVPILAMAENS